MLDLTDDEVSALRKLLSDAIEYDRYPLSPRIPTLRSILAKLGPGARIGALRSCRPQGRHVYDRL